MRDATSPVAHPINSFAHRIRRRQPVIFNVLFKLPAVILRIFGLVLLLLLVLVQRLLEPWPSHFASEDPFAVRMVFIFSQQPSISFRHRIAFAEKLLLANFVPVPRLAVLGNGNGKWRLLFRGTALELGYFFGRITPRRLGDLQAIICTFNHYAAAPLAEPFEIETVSHVFGWSLPASVHRHRFFNWNIEHAHFARGSDVTSRAELPRSRRSRRHGNRFGIFKAQLTPGEIRRAIAGQIQHQRLVDAREPDLTLYAPAGAIVDFATQNMLVKPPSHGQKLCRCRDCERTRFLGLGP